MSLSRGIHLFRQITNTASKTNVIKQQVRNSGGYTYRTSGHHYNDNWRKVAEVNMAIAWWWFLWHLYHEYDWITGEWDVPDPRKWTDEELGIPPDSEG